MTYEQDTRNRPVHLDVDIQAIGPLEPGATIVVNVTRPLTKDQAKQIQAQLAEIWPDHQSIIVPPGIALSVQ